MSKIYIYGSANPMTKHGACCWYRPANTFSKVITNNNYWEDISTDTTANEMLMKALVEAVKSSLVRGETECKIYTTSVYFYGPYSNGTYKLWKNKTDFPNEEYWKELLTLEEELEKSGIIFTVEKVSTKDPIMKIIKQTIKKF